MKTANSNDNLIWEMPFVTPMAERAFGWATDLIVNGHTGAVIYAPTRTGKTSLVKLFVEELKSFEGVRDELVESATVWVEPYDRKVVSEGGFWRWFLAALGHERAREVLGPIPARHLVYGYLKGLARGVSSGRVILLIDEAQKLELVELGWVADVFNDFRRSGFELIVFLVGSYHLQKWKTELRGKEHEHVRSRFFAKEWPLVGLSTVTDFRRCLRRYDVDAVFDGRSFTQYFHPEWTQSGGRLDAYTAMFREAFISARGKRSHLDVRMAFFGRVVRKILTAKKINITPKALLAAVKDSGYCEELDTE